MSSFKTGFGLFGRAGRRRNAEWSVRRQSLAMAVRLFECGGEGELPRAVLVLSTATLFERYLSGSLPAPEKGVSDERVGGEAAPTRRDSWQAARPAAVVPFPGSIPGGDRGRDRPSRERDR